MSESAVVMTKIAAMFAVMLLGYAARRSGRLDVATTALLGAATADVCLPALTFAQLLETVDGRRLATGWFVPLLGAGVILLGHALGRICRPWFATTEQASTFVFLGSLANWIYLPLPIVTALHGAAGVEAVLLINVGAQLVLWTVGVATLRGGRLDWQAPAALARNPGLIATAAGITVALILPRGAGATSVVGHAGRAILEAITLVGSLTIPLSLVVTGAQLGAVRLDVRPSRAALGVVLIRLLLAPAIAIALVWTSRRAGLTLPRLQVSIAVIVAAMPVAVSGGILTTRYQQDTALAAESIFLSTLGSMVTVPVVVWAFDRIAW